MSDEARHILVVEEYHEDDDGEPLFQIEHPDGCPTTLGGGSTAEHSYYIYECAVGVFEMDMGLDQFFDHRDAPARTQSAYRDCLAPGRYPVEAWTERCCVAGPWGPEEWDGGLRVQSGSDDDAS
jgi:hypothetical protein